MCFSAEFGIWLSERQPWNRTSRVLNVLLLVVASIFNISFESGLTVEKWREVLVLPSLKRCGGDMHWLIIWFDQRPTPCAPVAYKEHHSSESTLLKVKNDILLILNMEEQRWPYWFFQIAVSTVYHDILLDRLRSRFGVTDKALNCFTLYLTRTVWSLTMSLEGCPIPFHSCKGVQQGSSLGLQIFTVYTSKLFEIVGRHLPVAL